MRQDNEGRVCFKQVFPCLFSKVYVRHMTEFVFVNCVTISNVFINKMPVMAFFPQ